MMPIVRRPEGLVKISTSLYEAIMPMVKQQVDSQIKVRDFSAARVSIAPAEHASWSEARTELMAERKQQLKAQLEVELGAMSDASAIEALRADFSKKERQMEHDVDHNVHNFSVALQIEYNFLSLGAGAK